MEDAEKKEVRITWPADSGPAIFSNNATIQFDSGGIAYLTFFQAIPPVLMGTSEDQFKKLQELETIEAKPIIKIAMTATQLKGLFKLLQKHADIFNDSTRE